MQSSSRGNVSKGCPSRRSAHGNASDHSSERSREMHVTISPVPNQRAESTGLKACTDTRQSHEPTNASSPRQRNLVKQMSSTSRKSASCRSTNVDSANAPASTRSCHVAAMQSSVSSRAGHLNEPTTSTSSRSGRVDITNLGDALVKLNSEKEHHVNNSLIWIRSKYIKQKDGPTKFIQNGGLEKLFKILRGTNSKFHDISLSILGNIVTEDKARLQVMRLDGIRLIINILKTEDVEQIQNRACRTLANLAQNPTCAQVIHNEGVLENEESVSASANKSSKKVKNVPKSASNRSNAVSSSPNGENRGQNDETKVAVTGVRTATGSTGNIVNTSGNDVRATSVKSVSTIERIVDLLEVTSNHECQLTYLRALRLLGDSPRHRDVIIECQGLKVICACLKSSSSSVLLMALKTAAHFLHLTETEPAVWQFVNAEGSQSLLSLAEHHNPNVSETAASILLTFVKHELLRPCLGNAGAIQYFVGHVRKKNSPPKEKFAYVNAVCLFCSEVVNRTKIRSAGGLELFLQLLDNPDYFVLHYKLVSALVFFLYDEVGMDILLRNELVRILMTIFRKCAHIEDVNIHAVFLDHIKGNTDPDVKNYKKSQTSNDSYQKRDTGNKRNQTIDSSQSEPDSSQHTECVNVPVLGRMGAKIESIVKSESVRAIEIENTTMDPRDENQIKEDLGKEKIEIEENSTETMDDNSAFTNKKSVPKYSIDSPTYKSISDWTFETSESGPLNIFDAQRYNHEDSREGLLPYHSPPHSSPYTPMSTSPYHSPSWSITSSPSRSVSPSLSGSSRGNSPARSVSPSWSDHSAMQRSASESALSDISVLSWSGSSTYRSRSISPLTLSSSPRSRPMSPLTLNSPSKSTSSSTEYLWWGIPHSEKEIQNLQFAEDEHGDIDKSTIKKDGIEKKIGLKRKLGSVDGDFETENVVAREEVSDEVMRCSQDTSYSSPLYADPVYEQTMNTDFGKALRGESLLRQISSEMTGGHTLFDRSIKDKVKDTEPENAVPMNTEDSCYAKYTKAFELEKPLVDREETPESSMQNIKAQSSTKSDTRQKASPQKPEVAYIGKYKRRRSDRWSSSTDRPVDGKTKDPCDESRSIHVSHTHRASDTCNSKTQLKRDYNSDKKDTQKSMNPAKTTEDSVLVVLSRLSYAEELSPYLLCKDVFETLVVYLLCARKPFQRAERILHRFCSNAKCFETVMKLNTPVMLHLASVCQSNYNYSESRHENLSIKSKSEPQDKQIETTFINSVEGFESVEEKSQTKYSHQNETMRTGASNTTESDTKEFWLKDDMTTNSNKGNDNCSDSEKQDKTDTYSSLDSTITKEEEWKQKNKMKINSKCCDAFKDVLMQVSLVMTSEYGRGVVQHVMLSGSDVEKQTCVLSLPICCRDNELLTECMVTHSGLNVLLDSLCNSNHDDRALMYSAHALHRLAVQTDMLLLHQGVGMHFKLRAFRVLEREPFDSFQSLLEVPRDSKLGGIQKGASQRCCKVQNSDIHSSKLAFYKSKIYDQARKISEAVESNRNSGEGQTRTGKSCDNCVEFLVEGKVVLADRDTMCAKSEVFSAMLRGHYAESEQSRVEIQDAPYGTFRILCDILHDDTTSFCNLVTACIETQPKTSPHEQAAFLKTGGHRSKLSASSPNIESIPSDSLDCNTPESISPENYSIGEHSLKVTPGLQTASIEVGQKEEIHPEEVCLDILRLADRFMLHDVIHDVTMVLYDHVINAFNVIRVLEFAVCHHCSLLSSRCVAFMTSQCVPMVTRVNWYRALQQSPCSEDVMECFCDVITAHLPLKMSVCKLDK